LHKGLKLLKEDEGREEKLLTDEFSADYLGVGRNMAMAIRHWLVATGLAEHEVNSKGKATKDLVATALANIIWENDPYFAEESTWWLMHINLVMNQDYAYTWNWFFNHFNFERFDRSICVELLERKISLSKGLKASRSTLDRDTLCMLGSYARPIPAHNKDPEDSIDCPFTELGLMNYYRTTGYYQINKEFKAINFYAFMYLVSTLLYKEGGGKTVDIPFYDLVRIENSPGKVFLLSNEALFDLLVLYEQEEKDNLTIRGLAGERQIVIRNKRPLSWVTQLYQSVEEKVLV
jgi:hypothetical protein